jgi:hypothetical protein
MKAITLLLSLFIISCAFKTHTTDSVANTEKAAEIMPKIVYESSTRGFFHCVTIENGSITSSKVRGEKGTQVQLVANEIQAIQKELKKIELAKISTLEAPSEKRFYDAAPIAYLEVIEKNTSYKTTEFDGGFPPTYIEKLVNTILTIAEKK